MNKLLAATSIPLAPPGGFKGLGGPLGDPTANKGTGVEIFVKFLSSTIGLITIIAIIWFIFILFTGAIGMIGAGGDKAKLESSRQKITSGLIGLTVTIAAIFIIQLIGKILGIGNILDLKSLFEQIQK